MPNVALVYYWPGQGRAGAIFRMCAEAGVDYEHVSDFNAIAGQVSAFGGQVDTFAPPIVKENNVTIAQSTAATAYTGERLGFDSGIAIPSKATQFMADLADFGGSFDSLKADMSKLRTFIAGE